MTLIEENEYNIYQPSWLYTLLYGKVEKKKRIRDIYIGNLIREKVKEIDLGERRIITDKNEYAYERVIICTGALPNTALIDGLKEVIDEFGSFSISYNEALKLNSKIKSMKKVME